MTSVEDQEEYFANTLRKVLARLFSPENMPLPRIPQTEAVAQLLLATILDEMQRIVPNPRLRARFAPEPEDPVERERLRLEQRLTRTSRPIELYLEQEVFDIDVFVEIGELEYKDDAVGLVDPATRPVCYRSGFHVWNEAEGGVRTCRDCGLRQED